MKIIKFGGSIVRNKSDIHNIIKFLKDNKLLHENIIIIISAFEKFTSKLNESITNIINNSLSSNYEFNKIKFLIEIFIQINANPKIEKYLNEVKSLFDAIAILEECTPKVKDNILSYGDLISSEIFFHYLQNEISDATYIDSRNIFKTDSNFGKASINFEKTIKNLKLIDTNFVSVLAGFIGSDENSNTTTLGYENSNLTAILCSIAFNSEECQYITDTDGIFQVDPKLIKSERIDNINYNDAIILAKNGLKLFTLEQLELAEKYKVTLSYSSLDNFTNNSNINKLKSTYDFVLILKEKYLLIFFKDVKSIMKKLKNLDDINIQEININIKESIVKIHFEIYSSEFLNKIYKELSDNKI